MIFLDGLFSKENIGSSVLICYKMLVVLC